MVIIKKTASFNVLLLPYQKQNCTRQYVLSNVKTFLSYILGKGTIKNLVVFNTKARPPPSPPGEALVVQSNFFLPFKIHKIA